MADESADDTSKGRVKLPYVSFTTFTNFLDKFGENPPPDQIDKTFLGTYSGANQALLLSTLKVFGLIGVNGEVMPQLREIASDTDKRRQYLHGKLTELYPGPVELAKRNGTSQQLEDWFRTTTGYGGSTLRKAVLFYLNAAEYAGVPTSPHFKAPKAGSSGGRRRGRNASSGSTKQQEQQPATPPPPPALEGEKVEVKLGEAGVVTLTVNVRWLDLPEETFMALRKLTDDLRALADISRMDQEGVDE